MEPNAGELFEVDWGHSGCLKLCRQKRKPYAFALLEYHSRTLYLEFTHNQSFETFVRCHVYAFMLWVAAAAKSGSIQMLSPTF